MTSTDDGLLSRLHEGEVNAQQELFQRYQQRLRRFFNKRVPNSSDVDDCVSEVLTRALEGIRRDAQPKILDAWIHGIAKNVLKERYSEDKHRDAREIPVDLRKEPTDPNLEPNGVTRPDEDLPELPSDWEFLLGKRELWAMVHAAIDGISPGLQPIMRAHYELTMERGHMVVGAELADALQVPTDRVARQLKRARNATLEAITALVLARTGRDNCKELAQQLDTILSAEQEQAGRSLILNPEQSSAISTHIIACSACDPRAKEARKFYNYALPAVLPITLDDEEQRRAAVAFFSRTGSNPTVPVSPAALPAASATGPVADETAAAAGLIERLGIAATSAISRIPGANAVLQFAQYDPELFRRIAGAAAGGVGVIVVAVVALLAVNALHGHASARPARPSTASPPSFAAPATALPNGSGPGPGPGPGGPGPGPGGPGPGPGNPGPGNPGPGNPGPGNPGPGNPGPGPGGPGNPGPGNPGPGPGGPGSTGSENEPASFDLAGDWTIVWCRAPAPCTPASPGAVTYTLNFMPHSAHTGYTNDPTFEGTWRDRSGHTWTGTYASVSVGSGGMLLTAAHFGNPEGFGDAYMLWLTGWSARTVGKSATFDGSWLDVANNSGSYHLFR